MDQRGNMSMMPLVANQLTSVAKALPLLGKKAKWKQSELEYHS